jgi:putative transposase
MHFLAMCLPHSDIFLSRARVTREVDMIIAARGKPKTFVGDNGRELTNVAILH